MGHASLAVTSGYLRGLEIPSLKIEAMPRLLITLQVLKPIQS